MKKYLSTLAVSAALIIGCGSGSSVTDTEVSYEAPSFTDVNIPQNVTYQDYKVKVVDEEIVNANVFAPECNETIEVGDGEYILKNCTTKPTYISVSNGTIKDLNVSQTFPLVLNVAQANKDDNFVVTPVTTLLATAKSDEIKEFAEKMDLNVSDLYEDPSKLSVDLTPTFQKINAILIKAYEDGAISNKAKFLTVLRQEIMNNAQNGDFNVTKVAYDVELQSQQNPQLFGLVFMGNLENDEDILKQISELQHPKTIRFLGLVFDDKISHAKIKIYRADTSEILIDDIYADDNGFWTAEFSEEDWYILQQEQFIVMMEAQSENGIKLVSSIPSTALRDSTTKNFSPSKKPDLVISNVTTVENVMLEKKGAFNSVESYEGNKSEIKTYYGDKILKAAAVVKGSVQEVLENNSSDILNNTGANDTYDLVDKIVNADNDTVDVNVSSTNLSEDQIKTLEENITNDTILSKQINAQVSATEDGFEKVANENGNVFYEALAYYLPGDDGVLGTSDDIFRREYSQIVVLPSFYQVKTYYADNDEITWHLDKEYNTTNANFADGRYNVYMDDTNTTLSYSLDNEIPVFVPDLCKEYKLYGISVMNIDFGDVTSSTQKVIVNSYDVIDMFRRMPTDDPDSFKELQDLVYGKSKDEVNYELNRFVREKTQEIYKYFSDENSTNTCSQ